jgi:D-3-phosphoglycerate dehydrogenase
VAEVLVLSPSFGVWSESPERLLREAGVRVRRPAARGPLTGAQVATEVGDADALIVGLDDVDAVAIAAGPRLKVIAKHGVGCDNIDVAAATGRGIAVTNAPGANTQAVADLVMGLLLGLTRQVLAAHASVLAGRWETFHGPELGGRTLGIVGFGRIARAVAERARAFGMTCLAHDPYVPAPVVRAAAAEPVELALLLERSDVVTLHVPGAGTPLIGADELARMRPGAYIVNAARGDLVDERAVAAALADRRLGGYAADAFSAEPPVGSPLLGAPNVLLTPHIAAFTDRANERTGVTVVEDILAVLAGGAAQHPVTEPTGRPA